MRKTRMSLPQRECLHNGKTKVKPSRLLVSYRITAHILVTIVPSMYAVTYIDKPMCIAFQASHFFLPSSLPLDWLSLRPPIFNSSLFVLHSSNGLFWFIA